MTHPTSTTQTTEGFARLMDFFDKLAAYRSRSGCRTAPIRPEDAEVRIPEDIAPLIYSLQSHVARRAPQTTEHLGGRYHDSLLREAKAVAFPMEDSYPFTFKMRLHELYELEDWAKKINEEVQRSQMEYRSLGEQEKVVSEDGMVGMTGQRGSLTSSIGRSGRKPGTESRGSSHSLSKRSSRMFAPLSPRSRVSYRAPVATRPIQPPKAAVPFPKQDPGAGYIALRLADHARATKKRCIGRTKSMTSGTPPVLSRSGGSAEKAGQRAGWMYQGVVSSVEMERESTRPTPRVSLSGASSKGSGDKKADFGVLGRDPSARRCIGRRRATISGPTGGPVWKGEHK